MITCQKNGLDSLLIHRSVGQSMTWAGFEPETPSSPVSRLNHSLTQPSGPVIPSTYCRYCFNLRCIVFAVEEIKLVTRPLTLEDNWYFEVVEPDKISYTYKVRPAKDFGVEMVWLHNSIFYYKMSSICAF